MIYIRNGNGIGIHFMICTRNVPKVQERYEIHSHIKHYVLCIESSNEQAPLH